LWVFDSVSIGAVVPNSALDWQFDAVHTAAFVVSVVGVGVVLRDAFLRGHPTAQRFRSGREVAHDRLCFHVYAHSARVPPPEPAVCVRLNADMNLHRP
jgi:hypothetical protein